MISGAIDAMIERLKMRVGFQLEEHFAKCPHAEKIAILAFNHRLESRILNMFRLKFSHLNHLPFTLLAGAGYLCGHLTKAESKEFVRIGLTERDEAIACGRASLIDRVAVRLAMGEHNPYKAALERFAADPDADLHPTCVVLLRDYLLALVHTRRTEAQHAHIHFAQNKKTWMGPVLLNTVLKGPELDEKLDDPDFWLFCVSEFRKRNVFRQLA
jgi:hypothetical protein